MNTYWVSEQRLRKEDETTYPPLPHFGRIRAHHLANGLTGYGKRSVLS